MVQLLQHGYKLIGGIFGYINDSQNGKILIKNCFNYANITQNSDDSNATQVAGIVGYAGSYNTNFVNCANLGTITISGSGAGICWGFAANVENCYNTGNIISGKNASGVVYCANNISNCYNTGDITTNKRELTDAITASRVAYGCNGTVLNCYNTGNIIGRQNVAGILVFSSKTNLVGNCYNIGNITATGWTVGGIIAWDGGTTGTINIENCYNTGKVQTTGGNCGGILGGISSTTEKNLTISNSYNIGEIRASTNDRQSAILGSYAESENFKRELVNCYYLNGKGVSGIYTQTDANGSVEKLESNEMITQAFASTLGSAYAQDDNINDGYPYLVDNH